MKKLVIALTVAIFFAGCSGMTSRILGGNATDSDADTSVKTDSVITPSLIKAQFGASYKYGKVNDNKFFTPDKVNVVIDGSKVSIFVEKDALLMRPLFVLKAKNNTSCDDKYKAYIKKIVTLNSAYTLSASGATVGGSYEQSTSGMSKSVVISTTGVNSFLSAESVAISSANSDKIVAVTFNDNNAAKNMVCLNNLIDVSKHGATKYSYANDVPVFFVELEKLVD